MLHLLWFGSGESWPTGVGRLLQTGRPLVTGRRACSAHGLWLSVGEDGRRVVGGLGGHLLPRSVAGERHGAELDGRRLEVAESEWIIRILAPRLINLGA